MRVGKFPASLMERLLSKVDVSDPRVLLGPAVGEDVAVLDYGDRVLVAKSDPVTFATHRAGWHAVHVNANDVVCAGAVPRWFLATLMVPENTSELDAEDVFGQVLEACASLGVTLIGGHSEVTLGITQPIVAGCMLGEADKGKLVHTGGAMQGDTIVLTKGIALEGTALLAWDAAEWLARAGVNPGTIDSARELLTAPGISVVKEALSACSTVRVNSLHDPTEGGLLTGIREIASASGLGIRIKLESIPVLNETHEICHRLGLNPLGLLASGALLITLPAPDVRNVINSITMLGCEVSDIGEITPLEQGMVLVTNAGDEDLPEFSRDELARFLSS